MKLKFSTFSEMKKLVKLKNKKGLKDVVKFRSSIISRPADERPEDRDKVLYRDRRLEA